LSNGVRPREPAPLCDRRVDRSGAARPLARRPHRPHRAARSHGSLQGGAGEAAIGCSPPRVPDRRAPVFPGLRARVEGHVTTRRFSVDLLHPGQLSMTWQEWFIGAPGQRHLALVAMMGASLLLLLLVGGIFPVYWR